jgi:hypothetical protein
LKRQKEALAMARQQYNTPQDVLRSLTPKMVRIAIAHWTTEQAKEFASWVNSSLEKRLALVRREILRELSDSFAEAASLEAEPHEIDDLLLKDLPGLAKYIEHIQQQRAPSRKRKKHPPRGEGKATEARNSEIRRHRATPNLKPKEGYIKLCRAHPEMVYHDDGGMRIVDYSAHDYRRDWNRLKPN